KNRGGFSRPARADKSQVSTGSSAIAAVAEKGGNVAGRAPSCVLDAHLSHTSRAQRPFDCKTEIEMGSRRVRGIVRGRCAEQIAKRCSEISADFVAAPLDAGTDHGDHARGISAG